MYLSLPLQLTITRSMTVTVFTCDRSALPSAYTVTVPKQGRCRDLIQALSSACSLKHSEKRLLVDVCGTTKISTICHFHLATCTDTVHVANRWSRVWSVLNPGVANCTFGRVYSNTRVHWATCIRIHVADSLPRVLEYSWQVYHVYHNTRDTCPVGHVYFIHASNWTRVFYTRV